MANDKVDFAEIVELSKRAREFKHQCEGRIYTLRSPTDHEIQVIYSRHEGDGAHKVLIAREIVEMAIVSWQGVTLADVLDGQPPADLPYRKDIVPLLIDKNPNDYAALVREVFGKMNTEQAELEEDTGNSSRQSNTDDRLPNERR